MDHWKIYKRPGIGNGFKLELIGEVKAENFRQAVDKAEEQTGRKPFDMLVVREG